MAGSALSRNLTSAALATAAAIAGRRGRCSGRGQRAVGVLAEILVARPVEQVEGEPPSCSKLITAEETEMPRSRSTAIQSQRTRRRAPRAFTSPANWIAPPNSSNFSVSVVLPASGCEMIAKVRRRKISSGRVLINRIQLLGRPLRAIDSALRCVYDDARSCQCVTSAHP
jgi:hypothetical protein